MRSATIREAQHHLSKPVDEVRDSGQEIVLTRRGKEVFKIPPIAQVDKRQRTLAEEVGLRVSP